MVDASPILARNALFHALAHARARLIALIACDLAAFLGDAINPDLCALLTWWNHSNGIKLEWGRYAGGQSLWVPMRTCGEADN
jgi:hypothetical protein